MADETQWYTNKQLFEMLQETKEQMGSLSQEIERTTVLIRDYNGLREKISDLEIKLSEGQGKEVGGSLMWSYIIGGLGAISIIVSLGKALFS